MSRLLALSAQGLGLSLSLILLTGCGALVPGAALHADADADIAATDANKDSASVAALVQDEPDLPPRLPSDVQGDAYYSPSQVLQARAEEAVADDPAIALASYDAEVVEDVSRDEPEVASDAGRVSEVGQNEFDAAVLAADAPVLVDFSASWCAPCKRLAPMLDELAADFPDVKIVTVDIDQSPKLAQTYRVRSVPTLIMFRQGEPTAQHRGAASRAQLEQLLAH